jgi:hypothetical protein
MMSAQCETMRGIRSWAYRVVLSTQLTIGSRSCTYHISEYNLSSLENLSDDNVVRLLAELGFVARARKYPTRKKVPCLTEENATTRRK